MPPAPRTSRRKAGLAPEFQLDPNIQYARLNYEDVNEAYWERLYAYLCTSRRTEEPQSEAYKAKKAKRDPDTYTWDEAMASPYKD